MDKTLLLIKPDGVERGLIGRVLTEIEDKGFNLLDIKMMHLSEESAKEFYATHKGKDFFHKLIKHITRERIVVVLVGGENSVRRVRKVIGDTDPEKAEKGTIREQFGIDITDNTVHASDSPKNARREIEFFFGKEGL